MIYGLDLFSGIGGLSVALSDWVRPVAYCENDRYAQSVLLSRMADGRIPLAPIFGDVRYLDKACLEILLSQQKEADSMAGKLKKLTQEQVDLSIRGYQDGMSLADLAHIFSVTRQSMHDLLKRRIELRSNLRYGEQNHFYRGGKRSDARAWDICERAIRSGKLANPQQCSVCESTERFTDGRTAIQAHHDDYNKPLEVRWLCQKCHFEWHSKNQPVKIGESEAVEGGSKVDIIFGGFP